MSFIPPWSAFTPPNVTPTTTPPTAFTPSGVTPSVVAPVPFTPANVTPSVVPPTVFNPSGMTPSTTLPGVFFPLVSVVGSNTDLAWQPTRLVTPGSDVVVFVITAGVGSLPPTFVLFTLTAGAHAADSTHLLPADYDAATNAKTWVVTATGYVGAVLVDQTGDVLVDQNGNALSFG